jgi:TrmH family RNA methyltransferase
VALRGAISSAQNRHIAQARALGRKRARDRDQLCLVEGVRLIEAALDAGVAPVSAFVVEGSATDDRQRGLERRLLDGNWPTWYVSAEAMQALANTLTPQGVACVVPIPEMPPTLPPDASLVVLLDGLRDPGNLGTIIRTCHALGVDALLLTKDCVDPWAPKVLRAGMGGHFGLRIYADRLWEEIPEQSAGLRWVVAEADATAPAWRYDWTQPVMLVVGGEAHGASARAAQLADDRVRIPMVPGAESLNAAIACGMLLYEAVRQRGEF